MPAPGRAGAGLCLRWAVSDRRGDDEKCRSVTVGGSREGRQGRAGGRGAGHFMEGTFDVSSHNSMREFWSSVSSYLTLYCRAQSGDICAHRNTRRVDIARSDRLSCQSHSANTVRRSHRLGRSRTNDKVRRLKVEYGACSREVKAACTEARSHVRSCMSTWDRGAHWLLGLNCLFAGLTCPFEMRYTFRTTRLLGSDEGLICTRHSGSRVPG